MSSELGALCLVVRREATQFAVAAVGHGTVSSDEMRLVEMRSDEVR